VLGFDDGGAVIAIHHQRTQQPQPALARHPVLGRQGQQAFGQLLGAGIDRFQEARRSQRIKHRPPYSRHQRIPVIPATPVAMR